MKFKGLIHIHSNFSDGELELAKIKEYAQKSGFSFVLLADHSSHLNEEKWQRLQKESRGLSCSDFLMIPGLEFVSDNGWHTIVYNSQDFIAERSSLEVLQNKSKDSLSVLAHLSAYVKFPSEKEILFFDGIEVWNAKYDSSHSPFLAGLDWAKKNGVLSIAGSDSHSKDDLFKVYLQVDLPILKTENLIQALRAGDFLACNRHQCFDLQKQIGSLRKTNLSLASAFFTKTLRFFRFLAKKDFWFPQWLYKIKRKLF